MNPELSLTLCVKKSNIYGLKKNRIKPNIKMGYLSNPVKFHDIYEVLFFEQAKEKFGNSSSNCQLK